MEKELTLAQAAEILGIHRQSLSAQVIRGKLAATMRNGRYYITQSELASYDQRRNLPSGGPGFALPENKVHRWLGGGKGWPKGKPRKVNQNQSSSPITD